MNIIDTLRHRVEKNKQQNKKEQDSSVIHRIGDREVSEKEYNEFFTIGRYKEQIRYKYEKERLELVQTDYELRANANNADVSDLFQELQKRKQKLDQKIEQEARALYEKARGKVQHQHAEQVELAKTVTPVLQDILNKREIIEALPNNPTYAELISYAKPFFIALKDVVRRLKQQEQSQ